MYDMNNLAKLKRFGELAPERTLHMSSFTKLIAPGVRTGFMLGEPGLMGSIKRNEVSMLVSAQKSRNYMMKTLTAKRGDESEIHTTEGSY
jgi:DNA-binding transcriptional MocR family regulator